MTDATVNEIQCLLQQLGNHVSGTAKHQTAGVC